MGSLQLSRRSIRNCRGCHSRACVFKFKLVQCQRVARNAADQGRADCDCARLLLRFACPCDGRKLFSSIK